MAEKEAMRAAYAHGAVDYAPAPQRAVVGVSLTFE